MTENIRSKVLIVDDVSANLKLLRDALEPEGYRILGASNGEDALRIATRALPDIILLDILMPPGIDGYEVCRRLKQNKETAQIPVIFITVKEDMESLIEGFRAGGVDYITKPFYKEELLARVETHLKISHLTQELLKKNRELQEEMERREQAEKAQKQAEAERKQAFDALQKADEHLSMISQLEAERWGIDAFIGKSNTIRGILDEIRQLQSASAVSVLITGESGTGKELIARAIHFGGERARGPFIPLNCSAIPSELAESTLFGHVRGAFTGAKESRKGYFELADGGTLFLDEIGDMPLELQPKLLRVIEDGCFVPVGSSHEKRVNVRILAATNQDLEKKIASGAFREDLYFRLERFTVTVPPLRERKEDIPLLIEHFLNMFAVEMGIPKPELSLEALSALEEYHFPGNVRELKNIIEHALIKSSGSVIKPEHLHFIYTGDSHLDHKTATSQKDESVLERQKIEELMLRRARKPNDVHDNQTASPLTTNEEKILAYVREHGSISNEECRDLISVDRHRANYLLQKMQRYGLLRREGELRWARYYLP
jgi:DNA-binding NtrC family response regulator